MIVPGSSASHSCVLALLKGDILHRNWSSIKKGTMVGCTIGFGNRAADKPRSEAHGEAAWKVGSKYRPTNIKGVARPKSDT